MATSDISAIIGNCVQQLGSVIGERNDRDAERYQQLGRARDFILAQLAATGGEPRVLPYRWNDVTYENIELRFTGSNAAAPPLIVGAHYDSARKAPGANDNGTGLACLLALAQLLAHAPLHCPVRLVAFTNEEPPHTRKQSMGSLVYARELARDRVPVQGMISLETLSPLQSRLFEPAPLLVVGNLRSYRLTRQVARLMSRGTQFVSRAIVAPGVLPGVRSSDHWSFWQQGWPAVMLTAGGPLTYWHYHRSSDSVEHTPTAHLSELAIACSEAVLALSKRRE